MVAMTTNNNNIKNKKNNTHAAIEHTAVYASISYAGAHLLARAVMDNSFVCGELEQLVIGVAKERSVAAAVTSFSVECETSASAASTVACVVSMAVLAI